MSKTALITGITGQDGSYLAELLLNKGYERVVGIMRRSSTNTKQRIQGILDNPNFVLVEGDVTDAHSMQSIVAEYLPDEIYNLAAQSHVGTSFNQPGLTANVNYIGVINILEAIRNENLMGKTCFYQASTSEMFGKNYTQSSGNTCVVDSGPGGVTLDVVPRASRSYRYQDEQTQFAPQSPYAVAKVAAHQLVQNYRDAYGLRGSCGILFNHESPRRGEEFVTRKITKWIGEFVRFRNEAPDPFFTFTDDDMVSSSGATQLTFPKLRLGNLDTYRDWGDARDYVEAMWMMLQQDIPDDYIVATGKTRSIREFLHEAFTHLGISEWEKYVVIDPQFFRPSEVEYLLGDCTHINTKLGWEPKISFEDMVRQMVEGDIQLATGKRRPKRSYSR